MTAKNPQMNFPALAITHIHTEASCGPASELDPLISGALKEVLGQDTTARWSECFTTVDQLKLLLDPRFYSRPVDILCITDHANWRAHRLPDNLLAAAAADPRLCVGSEVATVEQDTDGVYRLAPEVLVYGGLRNDPHTGLTQEQLDDLFTRCRATGRFEPQTCKVIDYCEERGWAYSLAHPLDGHALSVDKTFELIGRSRFIETVNGGFPAASTQLLQAYLWLHNRLALGKGLPVGLMRRYPYLERVAERIYRKGLKPVIALGGSDAHSHNFDRVLVRVLCDHPAPRAVDLIKAMVEPRTEKLLADGTFAVLGRPGSGLSVLDDVLRIVGRNLWANRRHFRSPIVAARMVGKTAKVVRQELGQRDAHQQVFLAQARQVLPTVKELERQGWQTPAVAPKARLRLAL